MKKVLKPVFICLVLWREASVFLNALVLHFRRSFKGFTIIFITTLVYSVLNPINVNSTLTGTSKREKEDSGKRWYYMGKTNGTQEMYLSGLLETFCINNVNPREGRQVSIEETYSIYV